MIDRIANYDDDNFSVHQPPRNKKLKLFDKGLVRKPIKLKFLQLA